MLNDDFNDLGMQRAPIVRETGRETVFRGFGHSHFSFVEGEGFHVTTQIPGMRGTGLDDGFSLHDPVDDMFKKF